MTTPCARPVHVSVSVSLCLSVGRSVAGGSFVAHEDGQSLTVLVNLSQAPSFEGGGTAFWSLADRVDRRQHKQCGLRQHEQGGGTGSTDELFRRLHSPQLREKKRRRRTEIATATETETETETETKTETERQRERCQPPTLTLSPPPGRQTETETETETEKRERKRERERCRPPTLALNPPTGSAILFGGTVTHAGLAVTSGVRGVFVASFSPRHTPPPC